MLRFLSFLTIVALFAPLAVHAELPTTIWADWLPRAASPVKHHIHDFHTLLRRRLLDDDFSLGKRRGADKRGKGQRSKQGIAQSHGNSFIGVHPCTLLMG